MKILRKIIADGVHYFTRQGFGSKKWEKQFAYFGEGAKVSYPTKITGYEHISIGDNTVILEYGRIENYRTNADVIFAPPPFGIAIGRNCNIGYHFSILNASNVTIGDNVLIASHVLITSENHGMNPEMISYTRKHQPLVSEPVEIGDGCWIGENVCILPGVKIGKKSIIGAGSVVTKPIPAYSIAVGNPAKVIKKWEFDSHKWINV